MFKLSDRLANPLVPEQAQIMNLKNGEPLYLSPYLFESFMSGNQKIKINPYKNDIFGLGLIILEAGLLEPIQNIYNFENGEFQYGYLENFKNKFFEKYDDAILKELMDLMLEVDEDARVTPIKLQKNVNNILASLDEQGGEEEPIRDSQGEYYQPEMEQSDEINAEVSNIRKNTDGQIVKDWEIPVVENSANEGQHELELDNQSEGEHYDSHNQSDGKFEREADKSDNENPSVNMIDSEVRDDEHENRDMLVDKNESMKNKYLQELGEEYRTDPLLMGRSPQETNPKDSSPNGTPDYFEHIQQSNDINNEVEPQMVQQEVFNSIPEVEEYPDSLNQEQITPQKILQPLESENIVQDQEFENQHEEIIEKVSPAFDMNIQKRVIAIPKHVNGGMENIPREIEFTHEQPMSSNRKHKEDTYSEGLMENQDRSAGHYEELIDKRTQDDEQFDRNQEILERREHEAVQPPYIVDIAGNPQNIEVNNYPEDEYTDQYHEHERNAGQPMQQENEYNQQYEASEMVVAEADYYPDQTEEARYSDERCIEQRQEGFNEEGFHEEQQYKQQQFVEEQDECDNYPDQQEVNQHDQISENDRDNLNNNNQDTYEVEMTYVEQEQEEMVMFNRENPPVITVNQNAYHGHQQEQTTNIPSEDVKQDYPIIVDPQSYRAEYSPNPSLVINQKTNAQIPTSKFETQQEAIPKNETTSNINQNFQKKPENEVVRQEQEQEQKQEEEPNLIEHEKINDNQNNNNINHEYENQNHAQGQLDEPYNYHTDMQNDANLQHNQHIPNQQFMQHLQNNMFEMNTDSPRVNFHNQQFENQVHSGNNTEHMQNHQYHNQGHNNEQPQTQDEVYYHNYHNNQQHQHYQENNVQQHQTQDEVYNHNQHNQEHQDHNQEMQTNHNQYTQNINSQNNSNKKHHPANVLQPEINHHEIKEDRPFKEHHMEEEESKKYLEFVHKNYKQDYQQMNINPHINGYENILKEEIDALENENRQNMMKNTELIIEEMNEQVKEFQEKKQIPISKLVNSISGLSANEIKTKVFDDSSDLKNIVQKDEPFHHNIQVTLNQLNTYAEKQPDTHIGNVAINRVESTIESYNPDNNVQSERITLSYSETPNFSVIKTHQIENKSYGNNSPQMTITPQQQNSAKKKMQIEKEISFKKQTAPPQTEMILEHPPAQFKNFSESQSMTLKQSLLINQNPNNTLQPLKHSMSSISSNSTSSSRIIGKYEVFINPQTKNKRIVISSKNMNSTYSSSQRPSELKYSHILSQNNNPNGYSSDTNTRTIYIDSQTNHTNLSNNHHMSNKKSSQNNINSNNNLNSVRHEIMTPQISHNNLTSSKNSSITRKVSINQPPSKTIRVSISTIGGHSVNKNHNFTPLKASENSINDRSPYSKSKPSQVNNESYTQLSSQPKIIRVSMPRYVQGERTTNMHKYTPSSNNVSSKPPSTHRLSQNVYTPSHHRNNTKTITSATTRVLNSNVKQNIASSNRVYNNNNIKNQDTQNISWVKRPSVINGRHHLTSSKSNLPNQMKNIISSRTSTNYPTNNVRYEKIQNQPFSKGIYFI